MPCLSRLIQPSSPKRFRSCARIVLLGLCCACVQNVAAQPMVAVSIKPLQHLVAALTQGVVEPVLILDGNQDPHNISLRPSERRAMAEADLLLWIGPALELPLQDVLQQVKGRVLGVETLKGLRLLETQGEIDPHLWLDTGNARLIAEAVSRELQQLDPEHAPRYAENLQVFLLQLQQTHERITAQFSTATLSAWAVYHQAFAYFETEFALPRALRLKDSDNVEPGVRSALAFTQALRAQQLDCVVTEAGVNPSSLRALLDNDRLRVEVADILGSKIPVSASSFNELLIQVAQVISACSGARHE